VAEALGVPLSELRSDVEAARVKLLEARSRRVPPGTDDKVLASWNGLMISALALAHQVLDEPRFREAAERAAGFVLGTLAREDGGLHATARAGRAHLEAGLDDYAFVAQGLCDLYESTFEPRYLRMALSFTERIEQRFADRERGGYFTTSEGVPGLIARLKSVHDGALPAGAAVHALTLRRLAAWTGRDDLRAAADAALDGLGALVAKHPHVFSHQLMALDFQVQQPIEVVIAGARGAAGTESLLRSVHQVFRPQRVVALADAAADSELVPLLQGKSADGETARAYVCVAFTCAAPVSTPEMLRQQLRLPAG
jgi:hypothetical protein